MGFFLPRQCQRSRTILKDGSRSEIVLEEKISFYNQRIIVISQALYSYMYFRHETLMYGRFKSRPTEEEEKAAKLARLSKMKKIYLPPRISPSKRLHYITGESHRQWRA